MSKTITCMLLGLQVVTRLDLYQSLFENSIRKQEEGLRRVLTHYLLRVVVYYGIGK